MQYNIVQQHPRLGKEVLPGGNLLQLTDQQVDEFKKSLWEHGVVVVKQQSLSASQLKEFAFQTFGAHSLGSQSKLLDPEIAPDLQSSGVSILGNPKGQNQEVVGKFAWQWHHDKDHLPRTEGLDMNALYVVMLYGVEIPPEGVDGQPHTTQFLDMIEAYNNLDRCQQQQLEQISLYHMPPMFSKLTSEEVDVPKKVHPLVSTHKITGKKGLYLGSNTAIPVGMEECKEEAKQFWQKLFENLIEITPVYAHVWQAGDIVFWDNSQVMHAGTPYDAKKYRRIALRVGVVDNTQ